MRNDTGWMCGWIVAAVGWASNAAAEDFASLPDSGVKHVASGFLFPMSVGEFERSGDPILIPGTKADVMSEYERIANGLRTVATVYVYPPDSPAGDGGLAGARSAIEDKLASAPLAQVWSEGPFRVGDAPALIGEKSFYKIGVGAESSQSNLYYFDIGKWIVKVRITAQKTDKGTIQLLDGFVRALPWTTLGLTAESCTGSACRVTRPIPAHGALPEQLALLLATQKLAEILPAKPPACDETAIATALTATAAAEGSVPEPIRAVAACSPRKGVRASFLRMDLDQDIRDSIEQRGPDGLSLRGPISFVVRSDGKKSSYAMMIDGPLDAAMVEKVVKGLNGDSWGVFAKGDKHGKNPRQEGRFLQ